MGHPARREENGSDPNQSEKTIRAEKREFVGEIEIEIEIVEIQIAVETKSCETEIVESETEKRELEIAELERLAFEQRLERR